MNVEFAFPTSQIPLWLLILAVSLGLFWFALRLLEHQRSERLSEFVNAMLASRLLVGYDARLRRPLGWFTLAGFLFLAVALAQPRWGETEVEVTRHSRDILVVLDVSPSMLADDIKPNRLEWARQRIAMLADRLPGDRFGLVAFSGSADLVCPLTHDHGFFRAILRGADPTTIGVAGTNIEEALALARRTFEDEELSHGANVRHERAVLLVSDGEEVSGDAVRAAEQLREHARIYALGIGDPQGAEITAPDWLAASMPSGAPRTRVSRLDEETLIQIATAARGGYVRSGYDQSDVDYIHQRLMTHEGRALGEEMLSRAEHRYQWPLLAALLCFAGEGVWLAAMPWLRARRMRRETAAPEGARDYA